MSDDKKEKIQLEGKELIAYVDSNFGLKIPDNFSEASFKNLLANIEPEELKYWAKEYSLKRKLALSGMKKSFSFVTDRLKNKDFLNEMLKSRSSFSEMLDRETNYQNIVEKSPEIKILIDAFSDALEFSLSSGTIRNPQLAESNRIKADDFAKSMGKHLKTVRKEGIKSTRKIADRFNELEIKSFRGSQWSHNQVSVLIRRRKELGLEDNA